MPKHHSTGFVRSVIAIAVLLLLFGTGTGLRNFERVTGWLGHEFGNRIVKSTVTPSPAPTPTPRYR